MITYKHALGADMIAIHVIEPNESDRELAAYRDWLDRTPVLAYDTESTGTDPYARDWRLRLAQFSDGRDAYVLRADAHLGLIAETLDRAALLLAHNATFDALSIEVATGRPLEQTCARGLDTMTLSRLVDPEGLMDKVGVPVHKLKELARKHFDPEFDSDRELVKEFGRHKLTKAVGYAQIPIDNEVYVTYAGLDAAITHRLHTLLAPRLTPMLTDLLAYEARIDVLLASMRRRGLLVDPEYIAVSRADLREQWLVSAQTVKAAGLVSVETAKQVDKAAWINFLTGHGVKLGKTKNGNISLAGSDVAHRIDPDSPAWPVWKAGEHCRTLAKDAEQYLGKCREMAEHADGRLRPEFNSLAARTGRMSLSRPPLQQIPREGLARGCLIADPGHVLISADYAQIELRVAAALSNDTAMRQAILDGEDLHAVTARRLYGPEFTDAQRNVAKRGGLATLYGSGPQRVALACNVSVSVARKSIETFQSAYPDLADYVTRISRQEIVTTSNGRNLPVDQRRTYVATNYSIQSEARDVFARAMLRLSEVGLSNHLWLPVHDEMIVNVPEGDAEEASRLMESAMADDMAGVPIVAEAKVLGRRWSK